MSKLSLRPVFIAAILLWSPFIILPDLNDYSNLPQTVFIQCAAMVLLLMGCLKRVQGGKAQFVLTPLTRSILLFIGWAGAPPRCGLTTVQKLFRA